MTPLEGQIRIELARVRGSRTCIENKRALGASALLRGKTIAQALEIIPLLFNACGMAQAYTACRATESALGQPATPAVQKARELLVLMEWAREHLARILIDWPRLFGQASNVHALPDIGSLLAQLRTRLFPHNRAFALNAKAGPSAADMPEIERLESVLENEIYHMPPQRWVQMDDIQALIDWSCKVPGIAAESIRRIYDAGWASQGRCDVPALPPVPAGEMCAVLDADIEGNFICQPTWATQPRETSSYTRQRQHPLIAALDGKFGNGLLTRWVARLVELAELPGRMRRIADSLPTAAAEGGTPATTGHAQTEAARGRLYHFVDIEGERISNYRILAPTEWNFHPAGVVAEALDKLSLAVPNEKRFVAELLVNAIDPCVDCRVEYGHA